MEMVISMASVGLALVIVFGLCSRRFDFLSYPFRRVTGMSSGDENPLLVERPGPVFDNARRLLFEGRAEAVAAFVTGESIESFVGARFLPTDLAGTTFIQTPMVLIVIRLTMQRARLRLRRRLLRSTSNDLQLEKSLKGTTT